MDPREWLAFEFLGNSILTWCIATGITFALLIVFLLVRRFVRSSVERLAAASDSRRVHVASDVIRHTKGLFLVAIAAFFGSRALTLPEAGVTLMSRIAVIALLIQLGIWVLSGLARVLEQRREERLGTDPGSVAAMDMMHFATRVAVWAFVFLLVLDNLGVNITALVAGLGVGGIAVALAAQSILSDLFASLSIVLDKPFVVGDFLIIGEFLGSVEKVGLKTTRMRSLSGEQLIFSNTDLLNSRIRNYGRMFERRVVFSIGVTYQTSAEKLEQIPVIIREAIESQEKVRFDRAHFQRYGDFALIFEAVYYVISPDYTEYMDIQQAINLNIFRRFEDEHIDFAYPTQTLYLNSVPQGGEN
ncbi:MAG: mechanosensitive ion channel family protein [Woeseiaceae bacterium]|nr:mechanosensitive ion channel family protein [Woeseiaceae bacterium]